MSFANLKRNKDLINKLVNAAESTVKQLEATLQAARASLDKSVADESVAKANIDTAKKLRRSSPGAVAKLKIAQAEAAYEAAKAAT